MTVTHFNPTFEEAGRIMVTLDGATLDPMKHSTITFKQHFDPNKGDNLGGIVLSHDGSG